MPFHRLTEPTYPGGLPDGYDLINDPGHASVGGSGTAALADGQKSGGPNAGTYFVAFGEDGTSENFNRPAKALAENTDLLDDLLRTGIPTITFTDATASGSVTTVALTGEVYVGKDGASDSQAQRNKIVRVTDQNNNDLEVSGNKVVASAIHDGSSNNVVGTEETGFYTNPSVDFSPPIPNGTTYRVWYGVLNSFANISEVDKGGLFEESLRVIQNVSGEVRSLFRQIHSESSVNQAWDAGFDSTIRSLASAGLNERYRRARLQPAGFTDADFDVAGGGAIITRDGQAVTIQTPSTSVTSMVVEWPDKNLASLKIEPAAAKDVIGTFTAGVGGDIGYWHESEFKSYNQSGLEVSRTTPAGPGFVEVVPRDVRDDTTTGGANIYTCINDQEDATLNPDSSSSSPGTSVVECSTNQFFALTSPTRTAIRTGFDYLEITWPTGETRMYIISTILAARRVSVTTLRGTQADFGNSAVAGVRIRWIQASIKTGGYYNGHSVNYIHRVLTVIPPAILSDDPGDENIAPAAFFGAISDEAGNIDRTRALEWGVHTLAGALSARGRLTAEGGIYAALMSLTGNISAGGNLAVTGDATIGGDLTVSGDITCDEITADDVIVDTIRSLRPERFCHVHEDWINLSGGGGFLQGTNTQWAIEEILDTFTVTSGTPSAKNPGQLRVIGAGDGNPRQLAIRLTTLLPFAFANILSMTVVLGIIDTVGLAASMGVGFVDDTTVQNGGDDALFIYRLSGFGWTLMHRVGGSNGANQNTALGTFTSGNFITARFQKLANGNLQVYFNDSLITTVASADLPSGNATFSMFFVETVAEASPITFMVDLIDFVVDTGANRNGAP